MIAAEGKICEQYNPPSICRFNEGIVLAKRDHLESRYCFRRAAFRLLSSSSSTATSTRSRSVTTAFNRSPYIFPRQPPQQCTLQRRWYSDEVPRRTQTDLDNEHNKDEEHAGRENVTATEDKEFPEDAEVELDASSRPSRAEVDTEPTEREAEIGRETTSSDDVPETDTGAYDKVEERPSPKFRYVGQETTPKETVYIANLYYDVTPDNIRTQMEKFGPVENVSLILDSKGLSKG